jgi:hypothetical protein
VRVTYMSAADLPPRPDSKTGLPRPPHAPYYSGSQQPDDDPDREPDGGQTSLTPPGQGPVLVWYRSSRFGALKVTAWGIPIFFVLLAIREGFSIRWVLYWPVWLICALMLLGVYSSQRTNGCAAGSDWLALSTKVWVRTYDLVKVTCHAYGGDLTLKLTDSSGRKVESQITRLQADRRMWDLVYNGILHSVIASGAETNGMLHMSLKVPYPKPEGGPAGIGIPDANAPDRDDFEYLERDEDGGLEGGTDRPGEPGDGQHRRRG